MDCKKKAKALCGEQQYLEDTPHLTLYVNHFENQKEICDMIETIELPNPQIQIKGWTTFYDDPITNGHSLVLELSDQSLQKLQAFQMELVTKTSQYKAKEHLKRYSNTNTYSNEMKDSLHKYGFPFAGLHWRAHFTIASFKKDDYNKVWDVLQKIIIPRESQLSSLYYSEILPENSFRTIAKKDF